MAPRTQAIVFSFISAYFTLHTACGPLWLISHRSCGDDTGRVEGSSGGDSDVLVAPGDWHLCSTCIASNSIGVSVRI